MRLFRTLAIVATLAMPGLAHAQGKQLDGASAAGLCASALEFAAGARQSAGVATPAELVNLQATRDLFLGLQYPDGSVAAYGEAWTKRMQRDLDNATSADHRQTIANEIGSIARKCQDSMIKEVEAARAAAAARQVQDDPNIQPSTAQPTPKPVPPGTVTVQ